jgi:glycosyltransferase involved in cell wall biosynthesis
MRIVIDMQGAQTESRFRGIGRYTMAFAQAVVRNRGEHEIVLVLSGLFPETTEPIRAAFDGLLPQENIRVWHAPGPVKEEQTGNESRREVAELLREAFLASLQPDVIHISSLFEGFVDDAVTSVGLFDQETPISVILYDLIPLQNPEQYLTPNPAYAQYYRRKIQSLQSAATYLAISEFSRKEATDILGFTDEKVVNISTAIDSQFQPQTISANNATQLKQKFGIRASFVLYTGGADERKNLPRLIDAYAALPDNLRHSHQLLFAGKMPEGDIARFKHIANKAGLKEGELLFTGYVSDEELVQLYNLCALYVFPSWHEGFGLPALEAMACGAPVIGANTSSLPEVIGLAEALFDPLDATAISIKIKQALEDEPLRNRLREHGLHQATKFSWDATAKRAIAAWSRLPCNTKRPTEYLAATHMYGQLLQALSTKTTQFTDAELVAASRSLALNESAGNSRQLLLDVSELCQLDAGTGVQRVVRSYLKWLLQTPPDGFRIEPVYATQNEGYRYARRFTQRFLGLDYCEAYDSPINWQRGDCFFGLDMQHHVQLAHAVFYRQLQSDGVVVKFLVHDLLPIQLADLFKDSDAKSLHEQWLIMIAQTDGAVCVSRSTAVALEEWVAKSPVSCAPTFYTTWVHSGAEIGDVQQVRGLPVSSESVLASLSSRPTFLCVSTIEPRKRQGQILEAVEQLWQKDIDVNLVFVGNSGWKTEALTEQLRSHPEQGQRLFWLAGISDEFLEQVYAASTCLIAASLNEGFGLSLIEAARHGIPIIARDIPVFREVTGAHADYFTGETGDELASALRAWLKKYRNNQHPTSVDMPWSNWQQSAEKLKTALVQERYPRRQLLVDISELVQRDARTGIQRVVRSILKEWLSNPPGGYRVEPVYATVEQGYRYARVFTQEFLGCVGTALADEPIDYAPGDTFFGLDLQPQVQVAQRTFYQMLRRQGVQIQFLVHDLLCVSMPQYFSPGSAEAFAHWLEVVEEGDGAVCVSKATADDLADWLEKNSAGRVRPFKISVAHNGANSDKKHIAQGLRPHARATLDQLSASSNFLMVGTIEPRKGHVQVLDAFENLWSRGVNANLVLVGKQGWMVEDLIERLRQHPELNKKIYWLEGINDAELDAVYAASTCLIAASYGEGFGLPLIEAAQHKLPMIARDIPVFREVAGEHAFYFNALVPEKLAQSVEQWLDLHTKKQHPRSDAMPWHTWKQSANKYLEALMIN